MYYTKQKWYTNHKTGKQNRIYVGKRGGLYIREIIHGKVAKTYIKLNGKTRGGASSSTSPTTPEEKAAAAEIKKVIRRINDKYTKSENRSFTDEEKQGLATSLMTFSISAAAAFSSGVVCDFSSGVVGEVEEEAPPFLRFSCVRYTLTNFPFCLLRMNCAPRELV